MIQGFSLLPSPHPANACDIDAKKSAYEKNTRNLKRVRVRKLQGISVSLTRKSVSCGG
jgi:hypothetical protein